MAAYPDSRHSFANGGKRPLRRQSENKWIESILNAIKQES